MDPDETLAYIRERNRRLLDTDLTASEVGEIALELAEAARDLDNWLSRGGFFPAAWRNPDPRLSGPSDDEVREVLRGAYRITDEKAFPA